MSRRRQFSSYQLPILQFRCHAEVLITITATFASAGFDYAAGEPRRAVNARAQAADEFAARLCCRGNIVIDCYICAAAIRRASADSRFPLLAVAAKLCAILSTMPHASRNHTSHSSIRQI